MLKCRFLFLIHLLLHIMPSLSNNSQKLELPDLLNFLIKDINSFEDQGGIHTQQSELCKPNEQYQCFSVIPQDKYSVFLGDSIELPCVIRNMKGRVQWRAGSILLGWEREIPSRSRYRVIGNKDAGENNLQIEGVKAGDNGEFECQVSPYEDHKLLRRKTYLQVLIPPEKPRIHESPNSPAVETVVINRPDKTLKLNLICRAKGGNPEPLFTWTLNGEEVHMHAYDKKDPNTYKIYAMYKKYGVVVYPGSEEIHLEINRANLNDEDEIGCKVKNNATEHPKHLDQHTLMTIAKIRIYTEIGSPVISPSNAQLLRENDTLRVSCVSKPAGNPIGNIHWRWNLNVALQEHLSQRGRFSLEHEDISPMYYKNTVEGDSLKSELIINTIDSKYHGASLVCLATHHLTTKIKMAKMKLQILYPPKYVEIKTTDNQHKIDVAPELNEYVIHTRINQTIGLQCTSDWFYKEARLRWLISPGKQNGFPLDMRPMEVGEPGRKISAADSESFYAQSNTNILMKKEYNGGYVDCQSWYGDGSNYIKDTRVRLNIIYEPEVVKIDEYETNRPLTIGSVLRMTCRAVGGNPKPQLFWYLGNKKYDFNSGNQVSNLDTQIKTIDIEIKKEHNQMNVSCKAFNRANELSGKSSEVKVLNVHFPPKQLRVSLIGPNGGAKISENDRSAVECESDPSNPPVELEWIVYDCTPDLKIGSSVMTHLGDADNHRNMAVEKVRKISENNCVLKKIEGIQETKSISKSNGIISKIRYELNATWEYNYYSFICSVARSDFKGLKLQDQQRIVLPFRPQLVGLMKNNIFHIQRKISARLDPMPLSNPSEFEIIWRRNGKRILPWKPDAQPNQVYTSGEKNHILVFIEPTEKMEGVYEAEVSNAVGTNKFTFTLVITTPPNFESAQSVDYMAKRSDETATLECKVSGKPRITDEMVAWSKKRQSQLLLQDEADHSMDRLKCYKTTGTKIDYKQFVQCNAEVGYKQQMQTSLVIYNLNRSDIGTYLCEVNNGVGNMAEREYHVYYPFKPTVHIQEKNQKSGGDLGSDVKLVAQVIGELNPSVKWTKISGPKMNQNLTLKSKSFLSVGKSVNQNNQKYALSMFHNEPGLYTITLQIFTLHRNDFGEYEIEATNQDGTSTGKIEVVGTSKPDTPTNLRIVAQSENSIKIAWTQGFNGGHPQTYQVRWVEDSSKASAKYQDVFETKDSDTVTYQINDLKSNTGYKISVNARNEVHGATDFTTDLKTTTHTTRKSPIIHNDRAEKKQMTNFSISNLNDNAILIIVAVCVFGFVVLVINLLIISFLVKRRKKMAGIRVLSSLNSFGNNNANTPLSFSLNGSFDRRNKKSQNHLTSKNNILVNDSAVSNNGAAYTMRNDEQNYFTNIYMKNKPNNYEMNGRECKSPNVNRLNVGDQFLNLSQTHVPGPYDNMNLDYNPVFQMNMNDEKKTFSGYETGSDETPLTMNEMFQKQNIINSNGCYTDGTGRNAMISLAHTSPTLISYSSKYQQNWPSQQGSLNDPYYQRDLTMNRVNNFAYPQTTARARSIANLDSPRLKPSILKRELAPLNSSGSKIINYLQDKNEGSSSQEDPSYEKNRYRERLKLVESERKKTSQVFLGSSHNLIESVNSDCSQEAVPMARVVGSQNPFCLI